MTKSFDELKEIRKNAVLETANNLYMNGYSPFIRENFEEFLREAVEKNEILTALFEATKKVSVTREATDLLELGIAVTGQLTQYWANQAMRRAEMETPQVYIAGPSDIVIDAGATLCDGK